MLLKSHASLTCFRACFFLVGLRTYQHPGTKVCLPFRGEIFRYLGVFPPTSSRWTQCFPKTTWNVTHVPFLNNFFYGVSPIRRSWLREWAYPSTSKHVLLQNDLLLVRCIAVPEDKNQSSPIAPHTITDDVRPYAPASRLNTGLSKKIDGIWNRYNLKSTGRIYTFCVLKCSEKFKVLDLP